MRIGTTPAAREQALAGVLGLLERVEAFIAGHAGQEAAAKAVAVACQVRDQDVAGPRAAGAGLAETVAEVLVEGQGPLLQTGGGRVVPGQFTDAAQVPEGAGLAETVAEVLVEDQGSLQQAGGAG